MAALCVATFTASPVQWVISLLKRQANATGEQHTSTAKTLPWKIIGGKHAFNRNPTTEIFPLLNTEITGCRYATQKEY